MKKDISKIVSTLKGKVVRLYIMGVEEPSTFVLKNASGGESGIQLEAFNGGVDIIPRDKVVDFLKGEIVMLKDSKEPYALQLLRNVYEVGGVVKSFDSPIITMGMQNEFSEWGGSTPMSKFADGGQSGVTNFEVIVKTPKGLLRKNDFDGFTKKEIIEWCEARGWVYNQQGEKKGGNILKQYEFFIKTPTKYKVILPKKNDGGEIQITNQTIDRGGLGQVQDSILRRGGISKQVKKVGKQAIKKAKPISKELVRRAKIGFKALAKKVAKAYEGKAVKTKYKKLYGKTYSKAEAEEVGNKVASKVYRQQQAKK